MNEIMIPSEFEGTTEIDKAVSATFMRRVTVDRTITPRAALEATGRKLCVTPSVVDNMPTGEGEEVDVFFFKPDLSARDGYIIDDDLAREYELRGLKPDPRAQAAVNADDPAFADDKPNGSHWTDADGNRCYAVFDRWYGERVVDVNQCDGDWDDHCWFVGVRK